MSKDNAFDWSGTAASNTDIDGTDISGATGKVKDGDNALRSIMAHVTNGLVNRGSDVATASTLDLDAATTPSLVHDLTGTTTVTAVTLASGNWRVCRAVAAFTITAGASLIVNGSTSASYTTTAGDLLFFDGYGSSVVRVWVLRSGTYLLLGQNAAGTATANAVGLVKGQLSFPASQNASSDANTLDDYEEGTSTPTVTAGSGTITTAAATLSYVKVGIWVHCEIGIGITTNGTGASTVKVTLPFTHRNGSQSATGIGYRTSNAKAVTINVAANGTNADIVYYDGTYPGGDGAVIYCNLSYITTA